jgi:branched-chain amino acid transport system permease protein
MNAQRLLLATGILALAALLLVAPFGMSRYELFVISRWAVLAIAAIGLNLTLGYAGQVSLAQGVFVGIGAYTGALMTTHGFPIALALVVAVLLCFAVGWLLGYPALRVQHHYLAFVTLAFSTLGYLAFRNEEWLTKGVYGISDVPRPMLFGIKAQSALSFYFVCLASLLLVSFLVWWLIRSPWGRAFVALRENPVRALSLGVDTRRYTLIAFALGSSLGGVAGILLSPLVEYVDPSSFSLDLSLQLLMMVIVGGAGFFAGPYLGAAIAVLLPEMLRFTDAYYLLLYAGFVMILMIISPTGLLGILDRWLTARATRRASAARASLSATLTPIGGGQP